MLLIGAHESGHFTAMKIFNVSVQEVSIGFGPRLFKIPVAGTDWSLRLIPFGGSTAPTKEGTRQIYKLIVWKQFIIYLAGIMVNLLTLVLLMTWVGAKYYHTPKKLWLSSAAAVLWLTIRTCWCFIKMIVIYVNPTIKSKPSFPGLIICPDVLRLYRNKLIFAIEICLILVIFNLLPIYPLDGGRIVESLIIAFLPIPIALFLFDTVTMYIFVALFLYLNFNRNFWRNFKLIKFQ
ncbi:MAG: site-2 protease family protein [Patescibacteria group bacterium]